MLIVIFTSANLIQYSAGCDVATCMLASII